MKYRIVSLLLCFSIMSAAAEDKRSAKPEAEEDSALEKLRAELAGPGVSLTTPFKSQEELSRNPLQIKFFFGNPQKVEEEANRWMAKYSPVLVTPTTQFYALDKENVYLAVNYYIRQKYQPKKE